MTQQELSTRSGVSVSTLRQLQRGIARRRSERTLADVSEALRWEPAHLSAVADGRAPGDAVATSAPAHAVRTDELAELRAAVASLTDRLDAVERRLDQR